MFQLCKKLNCFFHKLPPKSITEHVIFKIFLGACPSPPSFSCASHNIIGLKIILASDFGWVCNWEYVWPPQYETSSYTYKFLWVPIVVMAVPNGVFHNFAHIQPPALHPFYLSLHYAVLTLEKLSWNSVISGLES